jgi:uroporphyrinogen decarboxylase
MTVFAKGAHWALADLARSDYDVIQLDWTMQPSHAREVMAKVHAERSTSSEEDTAAPTRHRQVPTSLQGNLDPAAMYANEPVLRRNVQTMVSDFCPDGTAEGYICNLGWGMQPFMKPEAARVFIEECQSCSASKD